MWLFKTQRYEKQTKTLDPFRLLLVKVHQGADFKIVSHGRLLRLKSARQDRSDPSPSFVIGVVKAVVFITVHGAPHLLCH